MACVLEIREFFPAFTTTFKFYARRQHAGERRYSPARTQYPFVHKRVLILSIIIITVYNCVYVFIYVFPEQRGRARYNFTGRNVGDTRSPKIINNIIIRIFYTL